MALQKASPDMSPRSLLQWLNSSLAHRFALAAASMAILACGVNGALSYLYLSREIQAGVWQRQEARTALVAQRMVLQLNAMAAGIADLTENPLIESGVQNGLENGRFLTETLHSLVATNQMKLPLALYDREGRLLAATQDSMPSFTGRSSWYSDIVSGRPAVHLEVGSGRIWLAFPVVGLVTAEVEGAAIGIIDMNRILQMSRSEASTLMLSLEARGEVIALSRGDQPIRKPMVARRTLMLDTPLEVLDLVLVTEQDVYHAMEPLREHGQRSLMAAVFVIFLVVTGSILIGRRLSYPLVALSRAARQVSDTGSVVVSLPPAGGDEVGSLTRDFATMLNALGEMNSRLEGKVIERTRSLQAMQVMLETSAERRRVIIENAPYGIISLDEVARIEATNPAALRIFGQRREQLLGRRLHDLVADPQRVQELLQTIEASGANLESHELEVWHGDGHLVPVELAFSRVQDAHRCIWICTLGDISARKMAEKAKDEFISTVSHELRTPLTSIRGALGLVSAGRMGAIPDAASRLIKIALSNSERLVLLVNDILDLQKIESGAMRFEWQELNLSDIVQLAIDANEGYARSFEVTLLAGEMDGPLKVQGDQGRLMQVLSNLISNAVKFSPKQGQVEVSLRRQGRMALIAVADRGPGIPPEFRDKIFNRFAQADGSDRRAKGGTGLGLAITKALVEHHSGRIGFQDREGGGTIFEFELPLSEAAVRKVHHPGHAGDVPRILHVDDDADLLNVVSSLLSFRAEVMSVTSLAEAERAMAEGPFDLLIIDISLKDGNGLRLMRQGGHAVSPVIIVFTCDDSPDQLGGVSHWIVKDRSGVERLVSAVTTEIDRIVGSESNAA